MTDISKLVDYAKAHPVAIKNPVSGEELGVVINVLSMNSARVIAASREYERYVMAEKASGNELDEYVTQSGFINARLVAAIDSWEWGGLAFGDLGADPECTDEAKSYLINHDNADWIKSQLVVGIANIANFTQASQKPARNTSRKK